MKIKWTTAQVQTRAGEMMPGETYEVSEALGAEFVHRGLAEAVTSSRPSFRKSKDEEDKK